MYRKYFTRLLLILALGWSVDVSLLSAQIKTLDRDLEPVIIQGACPDFVGAPVGQLDNELFLYAYRAGQQMWEQIPFQIDEKDAADKYFNPNGDETVGLDGNDELVFMAKDAGDRALTSWIDDAVSRTYFRYEFKITDSTNPEKMAWVYLYRSNTLTLDPNLTDYVDYFKSMTGNVGEDSVRSKFYEIANSTHGFPKDLIIPLSAGGNGADLLDLLKFRAKARITLLIFPINVTINEENIVFKDGDSIEFIDGKVRVLRKIDATLSVSVVDANFTLSPLIYYPYSASINIEIPSLSGVSISSGRISIDLNENASGMKFVSANNPEPGFIVDGSSDAPNSAVDNVLPDSNWVYIKGNQGTLVHLFPLSLSVGGQRRLYYKDNSSSDGGDTGDKKSFGDTGIDITNGINPPFTLSYKGYFLDNERTSDIGGQLALYEKNPLQVESFSQDFGTVPVELVSFTATVEQKDVQLIWITATETDNFGFDIERRKPDILDWQKIAFVPGKGTTTIPVHYQYRDLNLQSGTYEYRLKQIDTDGSFEYSAMVSVVIGVPEQFVLSQNYPNPFNPTTEIQYQLPKRTDEGVGMIRTRLKIYNLLGREVRTLVDKEQTPGYYTVPWDGTDNLRIHLPSGVYLYRLQHGNFVAVKKMVLVQ